MSYPTDGDAFNNANVHGPVSALASTINDLDLDANLERGGLNDAHLPGIMPTDVFNNGFSVVRQGATATTSETYRLYQADAGGAGTLPPDYQRFGTEAPVPYGAHLGVPDDTGWRIPAIARATADAMEVTVAGNVDRTTDNINIFRCSLSLSLTAAVNTGSNRHRSSVLLAIGVEDELGQRYVLPKSVRWFSVLAVERGPIGVTYTIDYDTHLAPLDSGTFSGDIASFFGVISSKQRIDDPDTTSLDPEVAQMHFTVEPIFAEEI